jgi:hypothetical protein
MMRSLTDDEKDEVFAILNINYDGEPHEGRSTLDWPTNESIQLLEEKGLVTHFIFHIRSFMSSDTHLSPYLLDSNQEYSL